MPKPFSIHNRSGQTLACLMDTPEQPVGVAIVMHGRGGYKEQPHIQAITHTLLKHQILCLRFDTSNGIGESDGDVEHISMQGFIDDLNDVVAWVQAEYPLPILLAGHSMGAMACFYEAANQPHNLVGVIAASTVISGDYVREAMQTHTPQLLRRWEQSGWFEHNDYDHPERKVRLPWALAQESLNYDVLSIASDIVAPVCLISVEGDAICPIAQQHVLARTLNTPLIALAGDGHSFRRPGQLDALQSAIDRWLATLNI